MQTQFSVDLEESSGHENENAKIVKLAKRETAFTTQLHNMINYFTLLLSWIVIKALKVFKKNSEVWTRQEGKINVKGEIRGRKVLEFYQFLKAANFSTLNFTSSESFSPVLRFPTHHNEFHSLSHVQSSHGSHFSLFFNNAGKRIQTEE